MSLRQRDLGHGGALVDNDLERAQEHAVGVDDHDDLQ
jgi:hypothetical protein